MVALMVPVWSHCVRKVKKEISKKKMPLLGIGASFSFLVMMFNIPLPGGTTGHAVGGTLVAILIGPEAACIAITIAIAIQALLFGDGGILAFGANSFNMAFILPFIGYYIYKSIHNLFKSEKGDYVSALIGSYIAINISAIFAGTELGLQALLFKDATGAPIYCPYPLSITIPSMLIPHLLVAGVLEALITAGVYAYIRKVSPEIIYEAPKSKITAIYALIIAIIIVTPLGLLAKGTAWGEWGADKIKSVVINGKALGFIPKGMKGGFKFKGIMPNYTAFKLPSSIGYVLSAIAGVGILLLIFKIIITGKKKDE